MVSDGDAAPDFILPGSDGETVREYMLAEFTRMGPVVLTFYAFDFHPDDVAQLRTLESFHRSDARPDVRVLAVSTDSAFSHQALAIEHDIGFPLLSDSDGSVCETYGVRSDGTAGHRLAARRAVFVIDDRTRVQYVWTADEPDAQPDRAAIEAALAEL